MTELDLPAIVAAHRLWLDTGGAEGSRADLAGADLGGADLGGANLRYADLDRADLGGAVGLPEAPVIPDIHRTVLAAVEAPGHALDMATWHTCDTTHCRAGWVVTLAGDAGRRLENLVGTGVASALIYQASDPTMGRTPDWHASNAEAMADMRRLAGVAS